MVRKSKKETELPNKKSEEELEPESEFDFDSDFDSDFESGFDDFDYGSDYEDESVEYFSKTGYAGDGETEEFGSDEDEEFLPPESDLFDKSGHLISIIDDDIVPLNRPADLNFDRNSEEYKKGSPIKR